MKTKILSKAILLLTAIISGSPCLVSAADDLNVRLNDSHYLEGSFWIYNDFEKARQKAISENKPLFVTFRCVPCHDCKAFDAEVAKNNSQIADLASRHFISARVVEMKGVDLSQFQFDYDLNWAGIFLNPDGTVYARYGTQSTEGADAYNSVEGLVATMNLVLDAHRNYPANKDEFKNKKGEPQKISDALLLPGLKNRDKYARRTEVRNCIHCHNIHDAIHEDLYNRKELTHEKLWKYPLPDNLGISIDPETPNEVKSVMLGKPAAKAGLKSGDKITHVNGQRILSIADIQWVLHGLTNGKEIINFQIQRDGNQIESALKTREGWKKTDISWRASMWNLPPRMGIWSPYADEKTLVNAGLKPSDKAIMFKWINEKTPTGKSAHSAGLRQGDVLLELNGEKVDFAPNQFHTYIKLNHKPGDSISLKVLRKGKEKIISFTLHR